MKEFALILIFLLIVAFAFWLSAVNDTSNREYIDNWTKTNGYKVESIEETYFLNNGPFWYRDDYHRIYKVETNKERTFWFKFGDWFGPYVEEYH